MGVQNIVLKNRKLTNFVMSRISPDSHASRGEKNALSVLAAAMTRTSAYPEFLKANGAKLSASPTIDEFKRLPYASKRDYIDKYELDQLCLDGTLNRAYTIERSSGHSGGSDHRLRLPAEDALFPSYLEHAFVQFYGMDTKSTLVMITLSLGTWTSGEKMAQALREVAASGKYPLTVMAPGTQSRRDPRDRSGPRRGCTTRPYRRLPAVREDRARRGCSPRNRLARSRREDRSGRRRLLRAVARTRGGDDRRGLA